MAFRSKWQALPTEAINPATLGIDKLSAGEIVDLMLREDRKMIAAVQREKDRIALGADLIAASLLLLAAGLGLTSGGALTLCYTIGGLLVPEGLRTTAFGFFSGAALFGGALSPWVAGELVRFDLRAIYHVDAALFALLALGLGGLLPAGAPAGPGRAAAPARKE